MLKLGAIIRPGMRRIKKHKGRKSRINELGEGW
jgi:hypothetical protein